MTDSGLLDLDKIADENQLDSQGRRPGEPGYNGTYKEKKEEATKEIQVSTTEDEKNTN